MTTTNGNGNRIPVIDADGHLMEDMNELAEYAPPGIANTARQPRVFSRGIFPTLDGVHGVGPGGDQRRERVNASEYRTGSAEDWLAFLEKAGVEQTVLFTSDGLTIGQVRRVDGAVALCSSYNDYVAERYRQVDKRLHPMALIPMQDPREAVKELRRAVKELDLPGAMLPSTGLPLDLGHEDYWPVYEEAANLGCVLAAHGGSNVGLGLDTFTTVAASHILHHSYALARAFVAIAYNDLFDRYSTLKIAFLEGGCGWTVGVLDMMERDRGFFGGPKRTGEEYLASGQVLIGCEGEDRSLPYLSKRVGIEPFAYSSDYPHEVDLKAAMHEIEETLESPQLSEEEKTAVLGGNAKRFFRI